MRRNSMSGSAIILALVALLVTWGGFGVCLSIAVKSK